MDNDTSSLKVSLLTGLLSGGAANAARQLHAGLRNRGVDSRLFFAPRVGRGEPDQNILPANWSRSDFSGLLSRVRYRLHRQSFKRQVHGRPAGNEIFTSPIGAPKTAWPPKNHSPCPSEIIHLHWVAKFIDYTSFFSSLPREQPVVWTLHDMNPFTGGCHFSVGCEQFVTGCGNCPQLGSPSPGDVSRQLFEIKRAAIERINLHVVTASRWMTGLAQRSPIFSGARSFRMIPYGLPLDRCEPLDRDSARAKLGIKPNAFVFCFGAMDIGNKRKGADFLLNSLQQIADLDHVQGLVVGGGKLQIDQQELPPIRVLGNVSEMQQRLDIYAACDVFVLPSIQDNMPLTGLEVLASGTPIVGFDGSGIPDFVRPGETGLLAENKNAKHLGQQVRYFAENPGEAKRMGAVARQVALREFNEQREADDYIRLYAALAEGAV